MDRDRRLSLAEVLQQLGADAQDVFVWHLQKYDSLNAARLVCSTLRAIVDGGVREACFDVRDRHLDAWEAGSRPPLHRWYRLSKLSINVDARDQWGRLFPLPLAHLPLDARQRITSVELTGDSWPNAFTGAAVASVLQRLPRLRRVAIFAFSLKNTLLEQELVYNAVASLPNLEELAIPPGYALEAILKSSAVASQLRMLEVAYEASWNRHRIKRGIGHLQQLQCLIVDSATNAEVRLLLSALPPNLRNIKLSNFLDGADAELHVDAGHVTSVQSEGRYHLTSLCSFVADALLPSGGLARRLERINLGTVIIREEDTACVAQPVSQQLSEVLRRCACVEAEPVFTDDVSASDAEKCLALLGDSVKGLYLYFPENSARDNLHLHLQLRQSTTQVAGSNQADTAAPSGEPSLADLALQRLFTSSDSAAGTEGAAGSTAKVGAVSRTGPGAPSVRASRRLPLLLLRRPFPSTGTCSSPEECAAVEGWTRRWARQAAEAASLARVDAQAPEGDEPPRYLPLPYPTVSAASAVLVQLRTAADLDVAAAAARLVAEARASAACAGGAAAAGALPAQVASAVVPLRHRWENDALGALVCAMEQELAATAVGACAGAAAGGRTGPLRRRGLERRSNEEGDQLPCGNLVANG